jgi:hypothetical protein
LLALEGAPFQSAPELSNWSFLPNVREDVYGMGAFRAQRIGVHEQTVEEDFDATSDHE